MAQTNKLEQLLNQNELIDNKIYQLNQNIKQLKLEKEQNCKNIWNECQHQWVYDTSSCFDDLVKYYCKKCNLYRCKSMYFK